MPDEFGGIEVEEQPSKDEFGGIALPDLIESKAGPIPSVAIPGDEVPPPEDQAILDQEERERQQEAKLAPPTFESPIPLPEPTGKDLEPPQDWAAPTVTPEAARIPVSMATAGIPGLAAAKVLSPEITGGLEESAAGQISGMTSPKSLSILPAFLIPIVGEALAGGMAYQGVREAWKEYQTAKTPREKAKAFGDMVGAASMFIPAIHGGVKRFKGAEPTIQPKEENAVHPQAETPVPNVLEPTVTEEGAGQMPTLERVEETGARSEQVTDAQAGEARPPRILLTETPPPQTVYPLATKNGQLVDAYDRPVDREHNLVSPAAQATPEKPLTELSSDEILKNRLAREGEARIETPANVEVRREPRLFRDMPDEDLYTRLRDYKMRWRPGMKVSNVITQMREELAHRAGQPEGTLWGNFGFLEEGKTANVETLPTEQLPATEGEVKTKSGEAGAPSGFETANVDDFVQTLTETGSADGPAWGSEVKEKWDRAIQGSKEYSQLPPEQLEKGINESTVTVNKNNNSLTIHTEGYDDTRLATETVTMTMGEDGSLRMFSTSGKVPRLLKFSIEKALDLIKGKVPIEKESAQLSEAKPVGGKAATAKDLYQGQQPSGTEPIKTAQPSAPSSNIEQHLNVPVPDVAKERSSLAVIENDRQQVQDEFKAVEKQIADLDKIIRTKPTRFSKGKIKSGARKADLEKHKELQAKWRELDARAGKLNEEGKPLQRIVDSAIDASIVSNPKEPLYRRLDRRIRMLQDQQQPVPKELVTARDAEAAKILTAKYPDITPEEIKALEPELSREQYFTGDLSRAFEFNPQLNLYGKRRAALDAAVNAPDVPKHLFPEELRDKLNRFRSGDRLYGGKIDPNSPVENLSAAQLAELKSDIRTASDKIRTDLATQAEKRAADEVAAKAQENKMLVEAQATVDSAKGVGKVGGRTPKEIRDDLVERIRKAIADVVEADNVTLLKSPEGQYGARTEGGGAAMGTIEKTSGGKFKVETYQPQRTEDKITATVNSLAEAEEIIKAMAASQPGKVVIGVPGDGLFRLYNHGPSLLKVWRDARKIDVGKPAKYVTRGGVEEPPSSIKTTTDWREAKDFHDLAADDKIYDWSPALRELASKINPEHPEAVTTKAVDDWIKNKSKAKPTPEPTEQRAQPEETPPPIPPEAPFGSIGPGAASRNEPPYSATSQLIDRLKTAPPGGFKERVSWREKAADEWARGKTAFERALARVQAVKESLKETQRGVRSPTDLDRRIGELDWQLQRSSAENKELGKTLMKSAPNQLVREATALWIDSGEDAAAIRTTLDKLPEGTPPRIRRALELATHLPEEGLKLAEEIKLFNAMRETDAIDSEIFERGLEDYYTHIWQKPSNMPDGIRAALSNGRINTYFQFAKERRIPDFLTGIEQGKVPVLDPARVLPFYSYALDRAIASREFIRNASEINAADGRPLLANTGSRSETTSTEYAVVGDGKTRARRVFDSREQAEAALGEGEHIVEREKSMLLIRPQGRFKEMEGYQPVNHPALRKWKWADTDENGRTTLYQGELLVHPDHWKRIANFMDRQRLTPSPATRALLRASGEVKAAKLGLFSLFHDVHVASHAVWHWTNPFKALGEGAKIDWESPATRFAVEKGHLKLAPDPAELNVYAEGLGSTRLVHKIPIIGPLSRIHSEWLFGELIPRLKLRTFENAYERNIKARDNLPGAVTGLKGLTDEEIAARVGDSVNNAYGELNHLFLGKHGRNPQVQRFLRGIFLAPDFGEARLRFVEKAFTKAGNEERLALATMALTTYALARVANWMSHGDPEMDWKNAFRIKAGNHWWSMRSVAGDVWHAMRDFSNFAYVRLNPLYSHAIGDWIYQRDPRTGLKLTTWDRLVKRRLEDLVPINATGLTQADKQVWESFVSSLGLQVQRETPLQAVRRMFSEFKDKSKDPKIQAQVERARAEAMAPSDYRDLDLALQFENYDKVREAIEKLRLTHTDKAIFDRMNPFTAQGNDRPLFHESFTVERRFYNQLPEKEKSTYAKAIQDRRKHWKAFQSLWGQRKQRTP